MATKRDLKKFIRNACGAVAAEILIARAVFPTIEDAKVRELIREIAELQTRSLKLANVSYDKTPRSFENPGKYRADHCAYYHKTYGKLLEDFDASMAQIVANMNAAMPEDVRIALKKAVGAE